MTPPVWLLAQAAAAVAPPAPAPAPSPVPAWTPVERVNPATGERSVSASASAPDGTGRLVVRCDHSPGAVISVQFIPRAPLRGFGVQPVSLRMDEGTALIDNWELLGAGAVEREDRATATLTLGIARAHHVRLHTVDRAGAPVDLVFDGPGGDAPIARVTGACGRTLGQVAPAPPAPAPPAAPSGAGG